jgi:hypothetical protein
MDVFNGLRNEAFQERGAVLTLDEASGGVKSRLSPANTGLLENATLIERLVT